MPSKRLSRGMSALLCLLSLFVLLAMPMTTFAAQTPGNASVEEPLPAAVTQLTATHSTPGSTKIELNWDSVADAAGYLIRRSTDGVKWTELAIVTETTYTNTGLKAEETYRYQVCALNASGMEGPSAASTGVDVCLKAPTTPKAAPVSGSSTELKLTWNASSGAAAYDVYQSDAKDGTFTKISTVSGTSCTVKSLSANKAYYFQVCASSAANKRYNSARTAAFRGKTSMAAPKSLKATPVKKAISLKWAKVSGAASYQVYRKSGSGSYALLGTATATEYKDKTAKVDTSYTYRVRAVGKDGETKVYGCYCAGVSAKLLPLSGCIVCVDAGHGSNKSLGTVYLAPNSKTKVSGGTTGTRGVYSGVNEATLTLRVGKQLQTALEAKGATVVMVRSSTVCNLNNVERCKVAKKGNAELTIRLHADGSENHSVHGISMQLPGPKYCSKSLVSKSKTASGYVYKAVLKATGAKAMGQITRNDLVGFNWATNPTILLEMGFMSNKAEDQKLQTAAYQKKIVSGIVSGTVSYFK